MSANASVTAAADEGSVPTILVVEDEVLVRMAIADYLRECGYRVFEAGSAAEAMKVLLAGVPISLVFSDVQMPGEIDGFGLAQWVRSHHSDVRVILTSGYARFAERAAELCESGPMLAKPYEPHLVLAQVRRLLAQD